MTDPTPDTFLLTAQCPGCQGWFSLHEPVAAENRLDLKLRLVTTRNLEVRCPYCGRGRRLEELQTRWLACTPVPEEP